MRCSERVIALGALLGALLLAACGGAPRDPERTLGDVIHDRRLALAELRGHPLAERQVPAFERADQWLSRVEAMPADPDVDPERLTLVLTVLEGQLVRIKATFARLDAEAALEARQIRYAEQVARIEAARRENAALRGDVLVEPLPMTRPERRAPAGGGR